MIKCDGQHYPTTQPLLEMIPGEPNPMSGGWNEDFTRPLIGYRKCGKSSTKGENRREIKKRSNKSRVKTSFIRFVF